jgi:hypothetical protein
MSRKVTVLGTPWEYRIGENFVSAKNTQTGRTLRAPASSIKAPSDEHVSQTQVHDWIAREAATGRTLQPMT